MSSRSISNRLITTMTPTIAAVILVYNAQSMIRRAFVSGIGQSSPYSYVLVVYDISTEISVYIDSEYSVRVLPRQHSGVSTARNVGIRESDCDWIAFLDADDRWLPDKIAAHREHVRADVDLTYTGF